VGYKEKYDQFILLDSKRTQGLWWANIEEDINDIYSSVEAPATSINITGRDSRTSVGIPSYDARFIAEAPNMVRIIKAQHQAIEWAKKTFRLAGDDVSGDVIDKILNEGA